MYPGTLSVVISGRFHYNRMLFFCRGFHSLKVFDCPLIGAGENLPVHRLNNWVSVYRNAKRRREAASVHRVVCILHFHRLKQPEGTAPGVFKILFLLELYLRVSQSAIKVSGKILLRDTLPLALWLSRLQICARPSGSDCH